MRNVFAKLAIYLLCFVVVMIGFSISTEVFAFLLNYHPALGEKQLIYLYEPFHIIYWALTIQISNNNYFVIAFSIMAFFIAAAAFIMLYYSGKLAKKSDLYGSSRFALEKELKKQHLKDASGVVMGMTKDALYKQTFKNDKNGALKENWELLVAGDLLINNGPEHIICIAPTRKGKGISVVIPTLLAWIESIFIYDIKKEAYHITSAYRNTFSTVLCFEPTSDKSIRFNPLWEIEKGSNEVAEAQNIAVHLCIGEENHWRNTAIQLITGVILHLLYTLGNRSPDFSLSGIGKFLNNPQMNVRDSLTLMLETKHIKNNKTHPVVAETARNMLNKSDNELSGVLSTAATYLALYQDYNVSRNTSYSDFKIADLMNRANPVSLYLVVNPSDADRLKPLTRLLLLTIGKKLTKTLGGYKHRLLFLIDEFPELGNLEFFETQLAFFAGYGIKCLLIAQSFNQLYKYYGNYTSIPDNCQYKIFLGANSDNDAKAISALLGTQTVKKENYSRSGRSSTMVMNGVSISESEVARPLMTSDEISRLPFDELLIVSGGGYPYRGKKVMYFADSRFKKKATPIENALVIKNEVHEAKDDSDSYYDESFYQEEKQWQTDYKEAIEVLNDKKPDPKFESLKTEVKESTTEQPQESVATENKHEEGNFDDHFEIMDL